MKAYTEHKWLSFADHVKLEKGICPACGGTQFAPGPRDGAAQNIVCVGCLTAFNFGPACSQLLAQPCPADRLRSVYSESSVTKPTHETKPNS